MCALPSLSTCMHSKTEGYVCPAFSICMHSQTEGYVCMPSLPYLHALPDWVFHMTLRSSGVACTHRLSVLYDPAVLWSSLHSQTECYIWPWSSLHSQNECFIWPCCPLEQPALPDWGVYVTLQSYRVACTPRLRVYVTLHCSLLEQPSLPD